MHTSTYMYLFICVIVGVSYRNVCIFFFLSEGAYEAPSPQNPYDDLQPRSFAEIETSNTYEQLKQYQNVSH